MTAKNKLAINKGVFGRTIMAICPKCRELFKTYEDWQGRGIMRKHCPPCKINVNQLALGVLDFVRYRHFEPPFPIVS